MAAGRSKHPGVELDVGGYAVRISSPDRVYFAARGETKLDLARYYVSVGDGVVRALHERPCMVHRFPDGVSGAKVHQKRVRAPAGGQRRRAAAACTCMSGSSRVGASATSAGRRWPSPATRDHAIASAYSVRGVPEATVSTPISWDEIDQIDPRDFTIATVPSRFAELGDLHAGIDHTAF